MNGAVVIDVTGNLSIFGKAVFKGETAFEGITTFIGKVVFNSDVEFQNPPLFNKDTVGFAKVKKGDTKVQIVFEKEYGQEPVVNVSITQTKLDENAFSRMVETGVCNATDAVDACEAKVQDQILSSSIKYAVVQKSTKGFVIVLSSPATFDITYSWVAFISKQTRTYNSDNTVNEVPLPASQSAQVAGVATSSAK